MSSPPTKPPTAKPPLKLPSVSKPYSAPAHVSKTFSIKTWTDADEGEKITLYAKSGTGKTTLAAMSPNAVFFPLDDGGRKITNPLTGKPIQAIDGITDYQDIRDALHQDNLFTDDCTIVFDTITKLEEIMEPYIFRHYKQKGATVTAMRQYGWDGPAHVLDCFRLLLTDLDAHVRKGRNVILLSQLGQITVANAEGVDYLEDGPRVSHNKQYSVRSEVCEWADHVFRLGYLNFSVAKDNDNSKAGKVQGADATRAVFTGGAQHYIAKSRPIDGYRIPPIISFEHAGDDSLMKYLFEGARAG